MSADTQTMMRIARLDEPGPPENLRIVQEPKPEPGDYDVLIKTEFAGLIYGDAEMRRGTYFAPTPKPWYPGREVVGVVETIGSKVEGIRPGDRVVAIVLAMRCCAEYVIASTEVIPFGGNPTKASDIIVLPERVAGGSALCYMINYRCAYVTVHSWGNTPKGATVLVHGAAGGMGSMVVQICARHGCEVIATVRTEREAEHCRALGAQHIVNITTEDYVERVKEITDGKLVDRSFNGVGGETIRTDPLVVKAFGEIHAYGYTAGKPDYDVYHVPRCIAVKTFSYNDFFGTEWYEQATASMLTYFEEGELMQPEVLKLDDIAEAHRRMDAGEVVGKLVLQP